MCGYGRLRCEKLDGVVYDWYKDEDASIVMVHRTEMRNADRHFAELSDISEYHTSAGWLFKFTDDLGYQTRSFRGKNARIHTVVVDQSRIAFGTYL